MTDILACRGCGRTKPGPTGDPTDIHPSNHCGHCPPWRCDDCGGMCSMTTLCPCWIDLTDKPLADIKGLLALGDLSLTHAPEEGP